MRLDTKPKYHLGDCKNFCLSRQAFSILCLLFVIPSCVCNLGGNPQSIGEAASHILFWITCRQENMQKRKKNPKQITLVHRWNNKWEYLWIIRWQIDGLLADYWFIFCSIDKLSESRLSISLNKFHNRNWVNSSKLQ